MAVLVRNHPEKPPRPATTFLRSMIVDSILLFLYFMIFFRVVPFEKPVLSELPHFSPIVVDRPAVKNKPIKHPKKQAKDIPWKKEEEKIREAFLQGKISKALTILANTEGKVPPRIERLRAEVEYAACRKAFEKKDWSTAVHWCERSTKRKADSRSKKTLQALAVLSRKFYLEGYMMERMHPTQAIERYRQAENAAPSGSDYAQKASKKLKKTR